MIAEARRPRASPRRRRDPPARPRRSEQVGRPAVDCARAGRRGLRRRSTERGVRPLAGARAARRSCRARARRPRTSSRAFTTPAASRRWRTPACSGTTSGLPAFADGRPRCARGVPHRSRRRRRPRAIVALAARLGLAVSGGSDYHGDESHGAAAPGSVSLPRDAYERLVRRCRPVADASNVTGRLASIVPRHDPRHRLGRRHFLVEQHLEPVEARAQLARLEQVIGRRRPASERALRRRERFVQHDAAGRARASRSAGNRSRCR